MEYLDILRNLYCDFDIFQNLSRMLMIKMMEGIFQIEWFKIEKNFLVCDVLYYCVFSFLVVYVIICLIICLSYDC